MHTYTTDADNIYTHHGDFSGEVWVSPTGLERRDDGYCEPKVGIPTRDMVELVAQRKRNRLISLIEQADAEDIINDTWNKER